MTRILLATTMLLLAAAVASWLRVESPGSGASSPHVDWSGLPVVSEGRFMPLDTLARESFTRVTGRDQLSDPETGRPLEPAACYLDWITSWRGWGHPRVDQLLANDDRRSFYFHWQKVDRWDQTALLPVDDGELRAILGLATEQTHVSPATLNAARIQNESAGAALPFVVWVEPFRQRAAAALAAHERAAVVLADRFAEYQEIRLGLHLHVIPPTASEDGWPEWTDVALTAWDKSRDPEGLRGSAQQAFRDWLAARPDTEEGRRAAVRFLEAIDAAQASARAPWTIARTRAEVKWRRATPSRVAWGTAFLGLIGFLAASRFTGLRRWRPAIGVACGVVASLAGGADLGLRGFSLNQWPLTQGCELIGTMATLASGLAVAATLWARTRLLRIHGTTVSLALGMLLWLAIDPAWSVLDLKMERVSLELGRSFWLAAHVAAIAVGGVALLLAALLGNVWLWRQATRGALLPAEFMRNRELDETLANAFTVGVAALALGLASGAVWSDLAWGQFFRGGPKESMALVVLLIGGASQFARGRLWIGERGTAVIAIMAASTLIVAAVGIDVGMLNGLHRPLPWQGSLTGLIAVLGVQAAFVAFTLLLDLFRRASPTEPSPTPNTASLRVYS